MRLPTKTLTIALFCAAMAGAAMAAPAASPGTHTPPAVVHSTAPTQPDCQKMGSDVSALIDQRKDSPNIATARAVFQVGIMECMEGSDDAANKHYDQAKDLLAGPVNPTAAVRVP